MTIQQITNISISRQQIKPTSYRISCTAQGFSSVENPQFVFESSSHSDVRGSIGKNQQMIVPYYDDERINFYVKYGIDAEITCNITFKYNNVTIWGEELLYNGNYESESSNLSFGNYSGISIVDLVVQILKLG